MAFAPLIQRYGLGILAILSVINLSTAAPFNAALNVADAPCTEPRVRREWRSLNDAEKGEYIGAIKCLMAAAPTGKQYFEPITSRYEDFVAMHVNATGGGVLNTERGFPMGGTTGIHGVGIFYPWHRYTVWQFEETLRNECNYTGAQPYWDWHLDTPEAGGSFVTSPLFDPVTGFGGNGAEDEEDDDEGSRGWGSAFGGFFGGGSGGGCIQDGPFKDIKLHLGPMSTVKVGNERCLTRDFQGASAERSATKANIAKTLAIDTYASFRSSTEGSSGLHNAGHGGMMDVFSSPNDPLFWMHHTQIDRIWAIWQSQSESRLAEMAGTTRAPVTLDSMLWMGFNAPDQPVRTVMDTLNRNGEGFLCYKYDVGIEEFVD
ncbi:Di-copper centre-containing protein [Eremomyces bilateralis CBS 781.70]|uniref:Di-copper centre-containing protein n=1 Tax=Eremomyces bilateralis CBS 781.70 TaxID=1392243 RepID=A0A6G1G9W7_9PEZI|nr:Di-copper centre-containing protein [Eremomyces bilateralis CBS 781.70]KAF1814736.1 Di-copper centre-containing protein [Eremomyces bilateralis CBS 781.70]